jgi:hypothetical protein
VEFGASFVLFFSSSLLWSFLVGEKWNHALSRSLFSSLPLSRACIFSKDADLSRNNRSLSASIFFLGETIAEAGKEALNRNNKFHT